MPEMTPKNGDRPEKDGWREQTPEFYKFSEAGQELIGRMVATGSIPIRDTEVRTYTLEVAPGQNVRFLGGVGLDAIMETVPMGQEIKLLFTGLEKTSQGYMVKKFRLWVK